MGKKRFLLSLLTLLVLMSMGSLSVHALLGMQSFCDFSKEKCLRLEQNLDKIEEKYPQQLFVERYHFADEIDENIAFPMIALECAREQQSYGNYRENLYLNRGNVQRENLKQYAQSAGLVMSNFSFCLDARLPEYKVAHELLVAEGKGIVTVPTVVINGEKYENIASFGTLDKVVKFHLGINGRLESKEELEKQEAEDIQKEMLEESVQDVPEEKEEPETRVETCNDDLHNQDEEDIDCGGVCLPCSKGEQQERGGVTFEMLQGPQPQTFFSKAMWNIKKFFWSISK